MELLSAARGFETKAVKVRSWPDSEVPALEQLASLPL